MLNKIKSKVKYEYFSCNRSEAATVQKYSQNLGRAEQIWSKTTDSYSTSVAGEGSGGRKKEGRILRKGLRRVHVGQRGTDWKCLTHSRLFQNNPNIFSLAWGEKKKQNRNKSSNFLFSWSFLSWNLTKVLYISMNIWIIIGGVWLVGVWWRGDTVHVITGNVWSLGGH